MLRRPGAVPGVPYKHKRSHSGGSQNDSLRYSVGRQGNPKSQFQLSHSTLYLIVCESPAATPHECAVSSDQQRYARETETACPVPMAEFAVAAVLVEAMAP